MSTQLRFRDLPMARESLASVTAVDTDGAVATDATLFYPQGGGQPGDSGVFITADGRCLTVHDTRKGEGGAVWHYLDPGHCLTVGQSVTQQIDWPRRWAHMRMHTALHLLSVLVPYGVTGGSIGAERGRLDFDLGEASLDKAALTAGLEALIAADHPVSSEWISEAELDARPELVKTMSVAPPRGAGMIRMVRIGDIDYQPCGGTHVTSTAQIGALHVASIKNRGARNRRITLAWNQTAEGQA
ncbi:alanyl-tRNA editing protein [Salinicola sp. JS01]|uniref:alanyl-tRNA editing protein n=1 Tax=Salinicola sp. JS01 TaxID=3050071 RepID=UPI00255C1554|nr:alanyl-tRNA editing protein [Salinicola sp. JS01]WIX32690.1 alanyl-tRNA editing protein [Salinicola sp. JS01]